MISAPSQTRLAPLNRLGGRMVPGFYEACTVNLICMAAIFIHMATFFYMAAEEMVRGKRGRGKEEGRGDGGGLQAIHQGCRGR